MASIGHVVVGMAAARFSRDGRATTWTPFGAGVLWSGLSLLPDADVFGFRLGVHYEDTWGHRGVHRSRVLLQRGTSGRRHGADRVFARARLRRLAGGEAISVGARA